MRRNFTALAILSALAPFAGAQDMPLSQILIDGEGWKKTTGNPLLPAFALNSDKVLIMDKSVVSRRYSIGEKQYELIYLESGVVAQEFNKHGVPRAAVVSVDGGTVFFGHDRGYIWAYQAKADGTLLNGHPYCPIRVAKVEGKLDPDTQPSQVTAMTGDKDGRIYAATPLGVQVFDPTGRLCGVLTPAAPGKAECLKFEGDKLTLCIGDQKYERKLNTSGVKSK
jgi:sugar lactone lactonase YvrE